MAESFVIPTAPQLMRPLHSTVGAEKKQLVEELHVPARRNFLRRRVIIRGFDDLWQADLVEMRNYADAGYHYILTVIDALSKYGWAIALKTKSGKEVTAALLKILKSGRCPKNLQTDDGKEFYNSDFQSLMKKHGINHYSTYSILKATIIERCNRTLKTEMWKGFTLNGNYKWRAMLQQLVDKYNSRKHRTIGMRPADVKPEHANKLLATVFSNIKIVGRAKFKVGDFVRISKYKNVFAKGYTPNWTTEIFEIIKVQKTNPVTYLLRDSNGTDIYGGFYEHELLKTANPNVYLVEKVLRKKGDKVFVKWLGFNNTHNSWINKNIVYKEVAIKNIYSNLTHYGAFKVCGSMNTLNIIPCELHKIKITRKTQKPVHCVKQEVDVFAKWVRKQIKDSSRVKSFIIVLPSDLLLDTKQLIRDLPFSSIRTEHEYSTWVRECRDYIQELRNIDRNASVGTRQKHFAEIASIKCLLLRSAKDKSFIKFGSGSNAAEGLIWEELESAFNGIPHTCFTDSTSQ
ncbi:uncharacterized protein [Prorops nasuta]|uniref:uncharacterized protein n=1 Tax=Prorops nasuta TaxID=863751 RepID=UPI0034CE60AD